MASKRKRHTSNSRGKFAHDGVPSVFTCPDCSGTLFVLKRGDITQFRCRVGHLYSPESMLDAQNDNVERSLWTAVRALEEQAEYAQQLATQLVVAEYTKRYLKRGREALENSKLVRHALEEVLKA